MFVATNMRRADVRTSWHRDCPPHLRSTNPRRSTMHLSRMAFTIALTFSLTASAGAQSQDPDLPQVFLDTTYPTQTGATINVAAGGDLQAAINAAMPGDTIRLEAGATFTGTFVLPLKSNPQNLWIVIRSASSTFD